MRELPSRIQRDHNENTLWSFRGSLRRQESYWPDIRNGTDDWEWGYWSLQGLFFIKAFRTRHIRPNKSALLPFRGGDTACAKVNNTKLCAQVDAVREANVPENVYWMCACAYTYMHSSSNACCLTKKRLDDNYDGCASKTSWQQVNIKELHIVHDCTCTPIEPGRFWVAVDNSFLYTCRVGPPTRSYVFFGLWQDGT